MNTSLLRACKRIKFPFPHPIFRPSLNDPPSRNAQHTTSMPRVSFTRLAQIWPKSWRINGNFILLQALTRRIVKRWEDPVKATYENTDRMRQKPLLLAWHRKVYSFMALNRSEGLRNLEIGSGSSFLSEHVSNLTTSNILELDGIDLVCSAYELPYKSGSMDNIFLINVFHHLAEPLRFLKEASRVLRVGGRVLISDPYVSLFSRIFWMKLHPEHCDPKALGFPKPSTPNPLVDANSANLSIMFYYDRLRYSETIRPLEVEICRYHSKFHYWLAGGVNFPQFVPTFAAPFIDFFEWLLRPMDRYLASFGYVVLTRKGG